MSEDLDKELIQFANSLHSESLNLPEKTSAYWDLKAKEFREGITAMLLQADLITDLDECSVTLAVNTFRDYIYLEHKVRADDYTSVGAGGILKEHYLYPACRAESKYLTALGATPMSRKNKHINTSPVAHGNKKESKLPWDT